MILPIPSMYGIFTYIYHKNQPNVGKYTIHKNQPNVGKYTIHGCHGLIQKTCINQPHFFGACVRCFLDFVHSLEVYQCCRHVSGWRKGGCVDGFCRKWMYPFPPKKNKLTWQWKIHQLKMYYCISYWKWGIFQCHASFQGCINTVLMEEILHHLGHETLENKWDKLLVPINWCKISSLRSSYTCWRQEWFVGFLCCMKMVVGRRTFPLEIDPFEGRCYFLGVCIYRAHKIAVSIIV